MCIRDRRGPAVITINGILNTRDDARALRNSVMDFFGIKDATMILNDTHGKGLQDGIQVFFHEYLGVIDAPAIQAARAIRQGINEKGEVFVVAHSQGTAIFGAALTPVSYTHLKPNGNETATERSFRSVPPPSRRARRLHTAGRARSDGAPAPSVLGAFRGSCGFGIHGEAGRQTGPNMSLPPSGERPGGIETPRRIDHTSPAGAGPGGASGRHETRRPSRNDGDLWITFTTFTDFYSVLK